MAGCALESKTLIFCHYAEIYIVESEEEEGVAKSIILFSYLCLSFSISLFPLPFLSAYFNLAAKKSLHLVLSLTLRSYDGGYDDEVQGRRRPYHSSQRAT